LSAHAKKEERLARKSAAKVDALPEAVEESGVSATTTDIDALLKTVTEGGASAATTIDALPEAAENAVGTLNV